MDDKLLDSVIAVTEIDDDLVSDALAAPLAKKRTRFVPFAAAAAALLLAAAALLLLRPWKKPDGRQVFIDPTPAPTEKTGDITTELPATEAPSVRPAETDAPYPTPSATALPEPTGTVVPVDTAAPTNTPAPEPTSGPSQTPAPTEPPVPTGPPAEPTDPPYQPTEPPEEPTQPPVDPTYPPGPTEPPVDPTGPPEPSDEPHPPVPTEDPVEFSFTSEEAFAAAIRNHAHPSLEGLTGYYVSAMHGRLTLLQITGNSGSVTFRYRGQDGRIRSFSWYRHLGQEALDLIAASNPGSWHGNRYILTHSTSPYVGMTVYWVEDGSLFCANIPGDTDDDAMERFCSAVWKPV